MPKQYVTKNHEMLDRWARFAAQTYVYSPADMAELRVFCANPHRVTWYQDTSDLNMRIDHAKIYQPKDSQFESYSFEQRMNGVPVNFIAGKVNEAKWQATWNENMLPGLEGLRQVILNGLNGIADYLGLSLNCQMFVGFDLIKYVFLIPDQEICLPWHVDSMGDHTDNIFTQNTIINADHGVPSCRYSGGDLFFKPNTYQHYFNTMAQGWRKPLPYRDAIPDAELDKHKKIARYGTHDTKTCSLFFTNACKLEHRVESMTAHASNVERHLLALFLAPPNELIAPLNQNLITRHNEENLFKDLLDW